ncbi:transaldolase family protein [Thermosipho atlanticus]|uniref:Transaldolase n=1 Tax=Thermosipho atlanticus DSM 15807 TaxID=1123380 RepID=A0A1M5TVN7_9BACT|nr:transaldolase family protein [Thermosipho atlanticus]SHH54774.1 Transaldolase [Thermosipho atlanticus DSM 15807]
MIFIDSISSEAINLVNKHSFFKGLTTNPTILKKNNLNFYDAIQVLLKTRGLHFIQISLKDKKYFEYLIERPKLSEKFIVKIPWIPFKVTSFVEQLQEKNYKICATAIYEYSQIISALEMDVDFLAIYYSRMLRNEYSSNYIQDLLKVFQYPEKFLVASLKSKDDINKVIKMGFKNFTIDEKVAKKYFDISFPENDFEKFENDFKED